ncbi:MAG: histidine kinase [Bacteroidota bacterium]
MAAFCALLTALLVVLLFRTLRSERNRRQAETRYNELKQRIDTLQLENLEARLNPHLFKNILNSIQSHAYQAYYALDKLANVLDYILYESRNQYVTPESEIEFALNLIEINKIKVSPLFELNVKKRVGEQEPLYRQALMAPLISIDLIENAFKHADLQSADAFIKIVIEFKDDVFSLSVSNKMSAKNSLLKASSGIGIDTLEQRLAIIYKDHFRLQRVVEEDVYTAQLKINLLEHKAEMLAAG